ATGIDVPASQTGRTTSGATGFVASDNHLQNAAPFGAAKPAAAAPITPNQFGRTGVSLRPGTSQTLAVSNQTVPQAAPRTGTTNARASAMAGNAAFFGRAATARRIEEARQPVTVAAMEAETAHAIEEELYETETAPVEVSRQAGQQLQQQQQRGERDGDHFIPPAAVMTEPKPITAAASMANPVSAPRQQAPQQQAPQQQPKRQGGFFDRLTGGN